MNATLEPQLFHQPLAQVWAGTRDYWAQRDPAQVDKAERDPRHQVALTFRWYLGMTSRWARMGTEGRKKDYQVWCGPSMGAFNDWAIGTSLAPTEARGVFDVADALMTGAAWHARIATARNHGLELR